MIDLKVSLQLYFGGGLPLFFSFDVVQEMEIKLFKPKKKKKQHTHTHTKINQTYKKTNNYQDEFFQPSSLTMALFKCKGLK